VSPGGPRRPGPLPPGPSRREAPRPAPPHLHLVVPGPLDQRTGGYLYDARMAEGLRRGAWRVTVHSLVGRFPDPDHRARASLDRVLSGLPGGSRVLVDGLAMGGMPNPVRAHSHRLRILGLVHHPLADETGLDAAARERLRSLEREALGACHGVLVTSGFTADRVEAMGVPGDRIRVVPPGTRPAREARGPGPDAPPRLLCVASVIPRKGHDVLIRALDLVRDRPWSCVCAGSLGRAPAFVRSVRRMVAERGLDGRIRFPGECEEEVLDRLYHTASFLVLPSHYEGYGMVLTEALVRGLPVVSTTGGAIPSTVPDEAAILVDPGDHEALAAGVGRLLDDVPERNRLAAAARRHGAALPDWEDAAAAFARALLELAPEPGQGPGPDRPGT
jgi:glycosyltransferase involved in cell wall biosynthesis